VLLETYYMFYLFQEKLRVAVLVSKAALQFVSSMIHPTGTS
jgi:hypothetical protein